jgi:membrane-bound lytic murein transglycosylase A
VPLSPLFSPVAFADLPGWHHDRLAGAFSAFRLSAVQAAIKSYRSGALGIDAAAFSDAFAAARACADLDDIAARSFFEAHFTPFRIEAPGFVTGYYEPVVEASWTRSDRFAIPLLSRPDDLVDLEDGGERPHDLDSELRFARRMTDGSLAAYFDRGEIERGALAGRGLEIAWLESRVDAFFIHVQGSARLRFADGTERRVTYAAKSGHGFTGPGRLLAELGEIPREAVTMQSIRAWFARHPDRIDEILWRNRSYIFFREAAVDDPALGPVAAAKVPLMPGRSLALDRQLHTYGTPIFVHAPRLDAFGEAPFARLMIGQDTGSAIVGPARADLFAGSGDAAGEIAGVVKHDATLFALLPKALAGVAR